MRRGVGSAPNYAYGRRRSFTCASCVADRWDLEGTFALGREADAAMSGLRRPDGSSAIALRAVQWQARATRSNHERDLEERSDSAYPTHDERCEVLESSICARMPALTLLAVNRQSQGLRLTIVSYATSRTSVQDVQMRRAVPICGSDGGERTRAGWDAWGAVV